MRFIAMLVRFFSFKSKIEHKRNSFCDGSNAKKSLLLFLQLILILITLGASFGFGYLVYLLLINAWYHIPMLVFTILAGIIVFFLIVQSIVSGIALDSACFRGRKNITESQTATQNREKTSKFDKFLGVLNILLFILIFAGVGCIIIYIAKKYSMF